MKMHLDSAQGRVPVSILRVHSDIDASNFQDLLDRASAMYQAGTRDVLLDLGDVGFVSSAGLVAIQGIVKILNGQGAPNTEDGWAALRGIDEVRGVGKQAHLKLLNPQPGVASVLERVGFTDSLDIYSDEAEAVASF